MASKKTEIVAIKPLDIRRVKLSIVGDTPIIIHAWSEKAKKQLFGGDPVSKKKEPRKPVKDFIDSLYWLTDKPQITEDMSSEDMEKAYIMAVQNGAKFGFPTSGLKQAGVSAAYRLGWTKDKMSTRGAFYIESEYDDMLYINGEPPVMREDCVKVGMGSADLRYRGEIKNWHADFTLLYNANGQYTLEDIINIINAGGYVCGLGEWRPERDGQYGMFHVATM